MTQTKKIPLSIPDLSGNEEKYLLECIKTNFVSTVGPKVKEFESSLSQFLGIEKNNVCALSSGTEALTIAIRAIDIKRDEHIIMPAYTFIATANSIYNAGCIPIILDVDKEDSYTLSSDVIKEFIKEQSYEKDGWLYYRKTDRKISAILSVSVLGHHPNLVDIRKICNEYNLKSIIDAAGAFGSIYKEKSLEEIVDIGTYSFNGNKVITTGAGGAVFSNRQEVVEKAKHIASTARTGKGYTHDEHGFNARMTNVHAAIGIAQIERASEFIQRRREIFSHYKKMFENRSGIRPFDSPEWCISNHWLSGFLIENGNLEMLIEQLNKKGILVSQFWKPIDQQTPYMKYAPYKCKNADELYGQLLILPSSASLTINDLEYIANEVLEVMI